MVDGLMVDGNDGNRAERKSKSKKFTNAYAQYIRTELYTRH